MANARISLYEYSEQDEEGYQELCTRSYEVLDNHFLLHPNGDTGEQSPYNIRINEDGSLCISKTYKNMEER